MLRTLAPSILRPILRSQVPVSAPAFYGDFGTGQTGGFALTRATTATYFDGSGVLQTAASGAQRIDHSPTTGARLGMLREPARTNRALWCRDLTNAAWTATTATVAKDVIGIDGAAASASSILATAGNATVLQAVTHTSTLRTLSAYVKRLVGTGVVEITLDNGGSWTAITSSINSTTWSRVALSATLANPTFGFRLVTNTDKIAVDYVQVEDGHCATSPILTTTVAVARNVDAFLLSGQAFANIWNATEGTILVEFSMPTAPPASSFPVILSANDTTANERVSMSITETTGALNFGLTDGGVVQATCALTSTAAYDSSVMRLVGAYKVNDIRSAAQTGTLATQDTSATLPTVTQLQLADQAGGSAPVTPMHFRRVAYWPLRLPDQALVSLATTG